MSRKPELFVAQGYFEEVHKNVEEARRLYKHSYEQIAPGLLDGIIKHIHLERRCKNYDIVDRLFRYALNVAAEAGNSGNILYVSAEYARFNHYVLGDLSRAIEIYENCLEKAGDKKAIYYIYINALKCLSDAEEKLKKIKKVFEFGLKNDSQLPASDQLEL